MTTSIEPPLEQPLMVTDAVTGKSAVSKAWWMFFTQIKQTFNSASDAVASVKWDAVTTTIDADDNITQLVYTRGGSTAITENRTYNAYGHIATQVLTGEVTGTWTHTYEANNGVWTGAAKT